jgi:NADH-quinone oxidoreductase subunit L
MLLPIGILAVLAVVGGWIQFAPFWHPLTNWLEPVARTLPIAEPTNWQEALSSILAVVLGASGALAAWAVYGRGRVAVPRLPRVQRTLEHKFYFDELYDAVFYRPASRLAASLRSGFEEPVVLATLTDVGDTTVDAGRAVRRLQTGLLRTYVFFLGTGMAVLAVVFLLVK